MRRGSVAMRGVSDPEPKAKQQKYACRDCLTDPKDRLLDQGKERSRRRQTRPISSTSSVGGGLDLRRRRCALRQGEAAKSGSWSPSISILIGEDFSVTYFSAFGSK